MNKSNSLKMRLKKGEIVIGPWCSLPSAYLTDIIVSTGMDFIILDMEHGTMTFEILEGMIRAADSGRCCPLVRTGYMDEHTILKSLELGAQGIIVPHIENKKECEEVVSHIKYYPLGIRGFSSFTRSGGYSLSNVPQHAEIQNNKTITAIIIENNEGLQHIDEILETPNLDLIYIGAYDLSQSLGIPGQVDHPKVKSIIQKNILKIRDAGISAGGYAAKNPEDIQSMIDMGMQFITYIPDVTVIYHVFRDIKTEFDKVYKNHIDKLENK